jgi:probable F420-dependent oxidoreductase
LNAGPRLSFAPWGESLDELVAATVAAERAGAASVWAAELHRSATVPMAAIAEATSTTRVGAAVMLAFVRSPMTIALEALDLDELAGGRLVLGLATGVQRLNEDWHGVKWDRPIGHLREVVRDVREFAARAHLGVEIDVPGERAPMKLSGYQIPWAPYRERFPIFIGAVGPQMLRAAGEIGDGWLGHELGSPALLKERILPALDEGLKRSGRSRDQFEVVASICCVPHDDPAQAKRWGAGLIAFYATVKTYEAMFDFHGFLDEARAVRAAFRTGDHRAMLDAVPDTMVDAFMLADTPDRIHDALGAYAGLADEIKLSPPAHFVDAEVSRLAQANIIKLLERQ